tara:strand:+ start:37 stop:342 length:306 start_codon:yes stop_codon:yes gene_type:complete
MKNLKAQCTNTKQVILTEPMHEEEIIGLIALASSLGIEVTVSQSAKILLFKCDTLTEVFDVLSEFGLMEYIGSLREIIEWTIIRGDSSNPAKIIKFKPKER